MIFINVNSQRRVLRTELELSQQLLSPILNDTSAAGRFAILDPGSDEPSHTSGGRLRAARRAASAAAQSKWSRF